MPLIDEVNEEDAIVMARRQKEDPNLFVFEETTNHLSEMMEKLNMLRKSRQFCDVILQVGSKEEVYEIYAHRAVLAAASPYLLEMFSNDALQLSTDTGPTQYRLLTGAANVDIEAFEYLVDFAYTGRLVIPKDEIKSVYAVANKLKMTAVAHKCSEFLVSTLTPENCVKVRSLPGVMSDPFLLSAVDTYIRQNIVEVFESKCIESLPKIQVDLLQNSDEERAAVNDRHLFNMILDWIKVQFEQETLNIGMVQEKTFMLYLNNRDKTLHDCNEIESGDVHDSDLVQDYKRLSRRFSHKVNAQEQNAIIEENQQQQQQQDQQQQSSNTGSPFFNGHTNTNGGAANVGSNNNTSNSRMNGHHNVHHGVINQSQPCQQQPSKPRQFLFTRSDSEESLSSLAEEDENDWKVLATKMSPNHTVCGLVTIAAKLCGMTVKLRLNQPASPLNRSLSGSEGAHINGQKLDSFVQVAFMHTARCAAGTAEFQGKLLVCGGYDRGECLKTVELYDPHSNKWKKLPQMIVPRGRFDITVVRDRVYAIGGCDGNRELSSAEEFDPETNSWKMIPDCPVTRSNAGVCNLNGLVYVIGGWNGQRGLQKCNVFDPSTNTWGEILQLQSGRYQAGVGPFDGSIYAVGGCDSWTCLNTVEKYNPETRSWSKVAPLAVARRGCGVAAHNGLLYAIGGHDGMQSLCSVEVYDPATNTWTSGPSLTSCRANVGVAVVSGRLFAVGGFNGKQFLNSIEFLDPDSNEWTSFVSKDFLSDSADGSNEDISTSASHPATGNDLHSLAPKNSPICALKKSSRDSSIEPLVEVEGENCPDASNAPM